jgi:membrane-bound lytic murein transglycosylase A
MKIMNRFIVTLGLALLLNGCATTPPQTTDKEQAALVLKPASFTSMPGWASGNQTGALSAFVKSCGRILQKPASSSFGVTGGTYGDWQPACRAALATPQNDASAKALFEQYFTPWQATANGDAEGLFTGYYEASLNGSRTRHGPYQYPLRAKPDDLIVADLGEFKPELKGQKITGRVVGDRFKPYPDNKAITEGGLAAGQDRPLVWVDDKIAAFFLQIQGSGTVRLDDGTAMRLNYAGQNGREYYAVGRELVKRGELAKEDVSMQSIRAWMQAHPDQAAGLMYTNPSYVFFRELPAAGTEVSPPGAEGVALTPGHSLAVDHKKIAYGTPIFLTVPAMNRLLVAQDTGGAIKGPVRGDVFWGRGADAEHKAGLMKDKGRMWLLLPKSVAP